MRHFIIELGCPAWKTIRVDAIDPIEAKEEAQAIDGYTDFEVFPDSEIEILKVEEVLDVA